MSRDMVSELVAAMAERFGIPEVAAGVWVDGRELYACHGITSTENPLPVDQGTLFQLGSVTKTFTATALMRLVDEGRVALEAPVRRYVPDLRLKDERVAGGITVLQLLNHTSGLDWGVIVDTGEGDDALTRYVAKMAELELIAPPGTRTSYSQAGYNLAGRIVEKVTGQTFERAVALLVFAPVGLSHSFFARDDVMTRRFAVGHNRGEDGTLSIARMWRWTRGDNPGGGGVSSVADQLRWARFHLGDARAESGVRVLLAELIRRMQEPTAALRGSNLGDAISIGWFLRDVDGIHTAGHGGSANGQFAELLLVPERNFAVVSLSNAGPDGIPCYCAVPSVALRLRAWMRRQKRTIRFAVRRRLQLELGRVVLVPHVTPSAPRIVRANVRGRALMFAKRRPHRLRGIAHHTPPGYTRHLKTSGSGRHSSRMRSYSRYCRWGYSRIVRHAYTLPCCTQPCTPYQWWRNSNPSRHPGS